MSKGILVSKGTFVSKGIFVSEGILVSKGIFVCLMCLFVALTGFPASAYARPIHPRALCECEVDAHARRRGFH